MTWSDMYRKHVSYAIRWGDCVYYVVPQGWTGCRSLCGAAGWDQARAAGLCSCELSAELCLFGGTLAVRALPHAVQDADQQAAQTCIFLFTHREGSSDAGTSAV